MVMPLLGSAQENEKIDIEQSAEVFLEEYTDEFQETFFEALKQKSIRNYDRAANLLLKCLQLDPYNFVVEHELAKVNFLDKNYEAAKDYAIEALNSKPENYWFLNTLVEVLKNQGTTVKMLQGSFPYENAKLQENLATIYFKNGRYSEAMDIIKGLKKSDFTEQLTLQINDSLQKSQNIAVANENELIGNDDEDPLEELKDEMKSLLSKADYNTVIEKAEEAIEAYPLQPHFYYVHGLGLNKLQEHKKAIEVLELGLDYLFDDNKLANQFYTELANAHRALGNLSKANEYLSKVKTGL